MRASIIKLRITRDLMIETVADMIPQSSATDLTIIRTAVNNQADYWRKAGYTVPDFAQDAIVKAIQREITRNV
jgi:hypothetical protein